jgi:hypothetical protein
MVSSVSPQLKNLQNFVNTWHVPNETRVPVDELELSLAGEPTSIARLPNFLSPEDISRTVLKLRNDLRKAIEEPNLIVEYLNPWLQKSTISIAIEAIGGDLKLGVVGRSGGAVETILSMVVDGVSSGEWRRLKCCPDCRWCFIDSSKNQSKRWCGMDKGGPHGRACGTIAKVSRFREKQKMLSAVVLGAR